MKARCTDLSTSDAASSQEQAHGDTAMLIIAMLLAMTLVLVAAQWLWGWSGPVFSSVYQGAIRFNSYVGLAAGGMLLGDDGNLALALGSGLWKTRRRRLHEQ